MVLALHALVHHRLAPLHPSTERGALFNPDYNLPELDFLRENAPVGGTFVDVGANVGTYAVSLAKHVGESGRVIAIEPHPVSSARLAFEQLTLLVKQSPAGRQLARRDIRSLLHLLIDVVIQCGLERHRRCIKEIWYRPEGGGAAARKLPSRARVRRDAAHSGVLVR